MHTYAGKSLQLVWKTKINTSARIDSCDDGLVHDSAKFHTSKQLGWSKVGGHKMRQFRQ